MLASHSIDFVVDEADRIRNIFPRNEWRCADNILRFRRYTERQFCPILTDLREAFRDDHELALDRNAFDAWRIVVNSWEYYRDTVGVVGCP
jgi:hypothetical protein